MDLDPEASGLRAAMADNELIESEISSKNQSIINSTLEPAMKKLGFFFVKGAKFFNNLNKPFLTECHFFGIYSELISHFK